MALIPPEQRVPDRRIDRYRQVEVALATELGDRLRHAREEAGLSQQELGDALGYAPTMIGAFEKGRRRLKVEDLARACIVLAKPPEYFIRTSAVRAHEARSVAATLRAEVARLPHTTVRDFVSQLLDEIEAAPTIESQVPILRHLKPEAAARYVLDGCGISQPPVQVADDICESLGIPIYWRELPDALSALLLRLEDGNFVIAVNDSHMEARRRFSVAHELGHAVLGHDAIYHLDYDEHAGDDPDYSYTDEREANAFAAALLMDERWVRRDFAEGALSIRQLATHYQVSEAAMGFRLINLGLA
jgi:transcriptional regulator with XRE-family HTH domain